MKTARIAAGLLLALAGPWALAQPVITAEPKDTSVSLAATARVTVSATSTSPPITYQWWFKDAALNAEANPSAAMYRLSLTNVTLAQGGSYFVVVSDTDGSVTSRVATLHVDPQFTKQTAGPVATDKVIGWSGHFGDYDGDGLLDLLVTGDYWSTGRNTRLYHNDGQGKFSAVTTGPWTNMTDPVWFGAWADVDNDGDLDVLLGVNEGARPFYLRNDGGGEFTRLPVDQSLTDPPATVGGCSCAWGNLDNDGLLDAVLQGTSTYPLRNLGNGKFTVLKDTPMYRLTGDYSAGIQFVDYDNDGDQDVFLPVEGRVAQLYRNDGGLQFTNVTASVLQSRLGMGGGGAWADFDNDGDLDVFFMGAPGVTAGFLVNNGDGTFAKWSGSPAGLGTIPGNWSLPAWGDYDNDGWLDLYLVQPGRLFRNLGDGNFEAITTGSPVVDPSSGKSSAWADYDNNGTLDLFVATVNKTAGNLLYQNNGNGRHWLKLRLKGTASNSHGVGARVIVQATLGGKAIRQMRDISAGAVIQELEAHFGLGDAATIESAEIRWPSGNVQQLTAVAADQILTLWEPPALKAAMQPDGACRLDLRAEPNRAWQIKASSDLVNWQTLTTVTPTTVAFQYTDTTTAGVANRYYRVGSE